MLKISVRNLEKSGNFYLFFFAVRDLQAAARKFLIIPNNRRVQNIIFCIKTKIFFLGYYVPQKGKNTKIDRIHAPITY